MQESSVSNFQKSLGASEMARAVFGYDWSKNQLGPVSGWSVPMKTAVAIVLRSPLAMTLLWGIDGVMLYNDAYRLIAVQNGPTALGQSVYTVWPEAADFMRRTISSAFAGNALSYRDQEMHLNRDARPTRAFFDLDFSPVMDESGQVAGVLATVVETTYKKASQEAFVAMAAESLRDRNRIWTLSQELMLICDYAGVICNINPAASRILGWTPGQMVGRHLHEFLHPDDVEKTAAEVSKLSSGSTASAFENRYRHKDGTYKLLAWTAVPEKGAIHGVARDITRERTTEEALRQSQKLDAIGQLTGGVAHDFNNVLAIIRNSVEVLKRLPAGDERRGRFIDAISNAVTRATRLTGQLLAFARRQALQPAVFDAGENTRAVSEMIASLAGVRIEIDLRLAEEACYVHADPSQFDTALVNLAVNARDAMAESGKLTILVAGVPAIPALRSHPAVPGDFVAVSISDTGSGIAPEHMEHIFEPFFTTKAVGVGTGLGLSQVFGFAKQSGGDIRVESVPGEGSTFTLYLPRASHAGEHQQAADPKAPALNTASGLILVVEDNPEVAASVKETLEVLGYTTVLATNAVQALAELHADADRFTAVFSDVVMTGMNGIELAWEISRNYGALPVVLTSGYSYVLADDADHGFALLPKPYSVEELAHMLHTVIHESKRGYRARLATTANTAAQIHDANSEKTRIAELERLGIMDTPNDPTLDEITRLAAKFCDTPIALISLIDDKRQWFKAKVGLTANETPREMAFCAHAIQTPGSVMMVPNAALDPRFASNPLVTDDPNIRFYAGAPLVTSNGQSLGTLCVIDTVPRALDARQLEVLQFLAAQVVERFEDTK
jgi:PAS domain S-box-containing protein